MLFTRNFENLDCHQGFVHTLPQLKTIVAFDVHNILNMISVFVVRELRNPTFWFTL